ncbi:hypothetical protein [Cellulomonas sp. NPDC089187]|uniref:hypothetical protein n=1 Tax=Cellulomonas sp. NPDC089187 TaxID=3154970 RepID=UPI00341BAB98
MTLDVVGERLDNALDLLSEVRQTLNDPNVGLVAARATLENHDARITTLEAWHTWLLRTVFGVIIVAGLGVVFLLGQP